MNGAPKTNGAVRTSFRSRAARAANSRGIAMYMITNKAMKGCMEAQSSAVWRSKSQ